MTETTYEYLPMPWAGARRLESDWREYRERRRQHLEVHPDYDRGWRRPTEDTARRIWKLVAGPMGLEIGDLLPQNKRLVPDEGEDLGLRAMQALVVALVAAVAAGERSGFKADDDELTARGMLTFNGVVESVALRWSDHYRATAKRTPSLRDMCRETVEAIRRDLLLNGLHFDALWDATRKGVPGIYTTHRIAQRGYVISVEWGTQKLATFDRILNADPDYERIGRPNRILLASAPRPQIHIAQRVAGERPYQVAEPGPRARKVIDWLQSTTVYLNTLEVKDDVARIEAALEDGQTDSRVDWARATRADVARIEGAGAVDGDGFVEIRTGIHLTVNRRYEADHLWPGRITDKDRRPVDIPMAIAPAKLATTLEASRRDRWFRVASATDADKRAQLIGVDVSASQFQIQAILIGDHELEIRLQKQSLKKIGVEMAWKRHEDGRQRLTDPDRLKGSELLENSVKQAALRRGYGSSALWIAKELKGHPDEYADLGDGKAIDDILREIGLGQIIDWYLPACRRAASAAYRADKYAGLKLPDPFEDDLIFRWNPIRRTSDEIKRLEGKIARLLRDPAANGSALVVARRELKTLRMASIVRSSGAKIYIDPPVGQPNAAGDYPVDRRALASAVAPCLIHVLDAMFLGLVVEGLKARGIHPVVIHDAFLVPEDAVAALDEAIDAAGEAWLRRLGPIYDALVDYLTGDEKFGPWAISIRDQWRTRVAAGNWPRFRTGATGPKRGRSFRIIRTFEEGEPIEGFWADVQRGNARRTEAEAAREQS